MNAELFINTLLFTSESSFKAMTDLKYINSILPLSLVSMSPFNNMPTLVLGVIQISSCPIFATRKEKCPLRTVANVCTTIKEAGNCPVVCKGSTIASYNRGRLGPVPFITVTEFAGIRTGQLAHSLINPRALLCSSLSQALNSSLSLKFSAISVISSVYRFRLSRWLPCHPDFHQESRTFPFPPH